MDTFNLPKHFERALNLFSMQLEDFVAITDHSNTIKALSSISIYSNDPNLFQIYISWFSGEGGGEGGGAFRITYQFWMFQSIENLLEIHHN